MRPFVLQDGDRAEVPASGATWPADPTRETPTQLIPVVPAEPGPPTRRVERARRSLLLAGSAVVALLAVVGWTVVRPALAPTVSTSLPDQQFPVVSGPAPAASVTTSGESVAGGGNADDTGGEASADDAVEPRNPSTSRPSVSTARPRTPQPTSPAATATKPTTAAPPAGLAPSPLTGPAALVSGNGLCLDLRGGDIGEGSDVHVDDCNGTSPQRWLLNSDRTLEVGDLCAYMEGDGGVELARCDGRNTAQWALNNDGRVMNAANGRCLTDPHFGARPANEVVVAPCAGTSNQRWTFR
ncbi:RICIN domain-containing protein [Actinoplanes aureus]|uniref:RICIN domain-containing protein n=1 Tax=Actinoplanes aureus TaxID=2792083 RepID=UPI00281508B5|nr:RICIN domain-containing protein [Actinoplanes aureus]